MWYVLKCLYWISDHQCTSKCKTLWQQFWIKFFPVHLFLLCTITLFTYHWYDSNYDDRVLVNHNWNKSQNWYWLTIFYVHSVRVLCYCCSVHVQIKKYKFAPLNSALVKKVKNKHLYICIVCTLCVCSIRVFYCV